MRQFGEDGKEEKEGKKLSQKIVVEKQGKKRELKNDVWKKFILKCTVKTKRIFYRLLGRNAEIAKRRKKVPGGVAGGGETAQYRLFRLVSTSKSSRHNGELGRRRCCRQHSVAFGYWRSHLTWHWS